MFPHLFALARDQQGPVCQAWQEAWALALPTALSDHRAYDLIRMQKILGDCQPSEGPDAWVWHEPRFSARAVYQRLREQAATEDPTFLRLWRVAWKSRLLLKIRILAWLLLGRRLKMRAFLHRVIPDVPAGCALRARAEETCEHLFITCPFASSAWELANVYRLEISSWEAFWRSFGRVRSDYRRSGSGFPPYSGPYGAIGTKSYSGDASLQLMPSSTTRGDLSSQGIVVAQANRLMNPFNLTLYTRHITI